MMLYNIRKVGIVKTAALGGKAARRKNVFVVRTADKEILLQVCRRPAVHRPAASSDPHKDADYCVLVDAPVASS